MRIDLHCHSTHSDGSLSAKVVAERALAREVSLFCLTDHDNCDGHQATLEAFPHALKGVELSCTHEGKTVHLLIYRRTSSTTWHRLEEALLSQREVRRERVHLIAERLAEEGVHFDAAALVAQHKGTTIGRPHIADELIRLGSVTSRTHAFDTYLRDGGPGDVKVSRITLAQGLELGLAAGGRMSLAHPHMHGKRAAGIVSEHKSQGLTGLEVYYGQYKSKTRKNWAQLASEHDLVATGGSDFHGAGMPQVPRLGVDVPDEIGKKLLTWLEIPESSLTN